jgi:single-stranded DNA-binding protein
MNRVHLIGVIVLPTELRHNRTTRRTIGKAMIAIPSGAEGLNFVPIILHDSDATDAAMYLGEGSRVEVIGHLHSALVTDRDADGTVRRRRVLHVIADDVTYLTVCWPRGGDRR